MKNPRNIVDFEKQTVYIGSIPLLSGTFSLISDLGIFLHNHFHFGYLCLKLEGICVSEGQSYHIGP